MLSALPRWRHGKGKVPVIPSVCFTDIVHVKYGIEQKVNEVLAHMETGIIERIRGQ